MDDGRKGEEAGEDEMEGCAKVEEAGDDALDDDDDDDELDDDDDG